jgi:thioredoxin-like negative regulator of GroEL
MQALSDGGKLPVILHFWASWAPMCTQTKQLAERLAGECPNVKFAHVEAEEAEVRHSAALSAVLCKLAAAPSSVHIYRSFLNKLALTP